MVNKSCSLHIHLHHIFVSLFVVIVTHHRRKVLLGNAKLSLSLLRHLVLLAHIVLHLMLLLTVSGIRIFYSDVTLLSVPHVDVSTETIRLRGKSLIYGPIRHLERSIHQCLLLFCHHSL